jgi:hypothetical protein
MNLGFFYKIKWTISLIALRFNSLLKTQNGDWVMGRVACLGQDVYKMLNVNLPLINHQKARIDYFNDAILSANRKTQAIHTIPYIPRDDIKGLILQQEAFRIYNKSPNILFMDSYSELTDQKFLNKKGKWSFYANYSDINHSELFKKNFESHGLLDLNDIFVQYHKFFTTFRMTYGQVPIIFIHFPVKLETREKFKERFTVIKNSIDVLKNEFEPFYSFEVDEEIVDWPTDDRFAEDKSFPYHYNEETYENFVSQLRSSKGFRFPL